MDRGYIKLYRSIQDRRQWTQEPFDRNRAWIDLLLLANHKPGQLRIRGILIDIKRGQVGWSERRLAERWRWSRNKLRRFFSELEMAQQISRQTIQQNVRLSSLVTIVNYDLYQETIQQNKT